MGKYTLTERASVNSFKKKFLDKFDVNCNRCYIKSEQI